MMLYEILKLSHAFEGLNSCLQFLPYVVKAHRCVEAERERRVASSHILFPKGDTIGCLPII